MELDTHFRNLTSESLKKGFQERQLREAKHLVDVCSCGFPEGVLRRCIG